MEQKLFPNEKEEISVWFDGAAWLWEKAGYGYVIKKGEEWLTQDYGTVPCDAKNATSNTAEHYALGQAMDWLLKNGYQENPIKVFGDSKLVIFQMFKGWKCNDDSLPYAPYFYENKERIKQFSDIQGIAMSRIKNEEADELSKKGLHYSNIEKINDAR